MTQRDAGSILIEALVSVAVVAAVLAALFQTIEAAALHRRAAAARREALLVAESELAAVGSAIGVSPGEVAGADGAYRWRVRIDPPIQETLETSRAGLLYPVEVSVGPAAGGPDLVSLKTLRVAPAT